MGIGGFGGTVRALLLVFDDSNPPAPAEPWEWEGWGSEWRRLPGGQ